MTRGRSFWRDCGEFDKIFEFLLEYVLTLSIHTVVGGRDDARFPSVNRLLFVAKVLFVR